MESSITGNLFHGADSRASFAREAQFPTAYLLNDGREHSLRVPVGTSLADVERWMIFATLQKSGGNKTRAAGLLGVSLKTLYNRLNEYRAQGVSIDHGLVVDHRASDDGGLGDAADKEVTVAALHGDLVEVTR